MIQLKNQGNYISNLINFNRSAERSVVE